MRDRSPALTLQRHLPMIVLILCLAQPVMDVLSFWLDRWGLGNTITLILRFCVLVTMVVVGFCISERKRIYVIAAAALLLFTVCHGAVCCVYGYQDPVSDLTNLVRIYQFPLTVLCFVTFVRENPRCVDAVKVGFTGCLGIIILVEILATVTGTDPHTYANKAVGVLGWFMTPSAQSAILTMLVPVAVTFVMERKKFHPGYTAAAGVIGFGVLYMFATRLSYAALVGCAAVLAVSCLILKRLHRVPAGKAAVILAAIAVLAILLAGVSPMQVNTDKVAAVAVQKQADIDSMVAQDGAAAETAGLSGDELELASLKSAYEKYLPGVTGRFGLERVAEYYGYSTDMNEICNARLQKRAYCELLLEEQPLARIFGLELSDMMFDSATYDAENDVHGIYFLCGWVGLVLLFALLIFFAGSILIPLFRKFRVRFTLSVAGWGSALICGLAHAYFTAGVLRRPNSSFYLACILAMLFCEIGAAASNREIDEV